MTDTSDSATDTGSLRHAVAEADAASAPSTIRFVLTTPATIALTAGELEFSDAAEAIKIIGPGAAKLTIDGGGSSRILQVDPGVSATVSGLTIEDGSDSTSGGAIQNSGSLSMTGVAISGSSAPIGGGLYNSGSATLTDCTITGDQASTSGGGIENDGFSSSLALVDCSVSGDSANLAAAIRNDYGTLTATGTVISGNTGYAAVASYGGTGQNAGQGGSTTLTDSTVTGTVNGEGVYGLHASFIVEGCTITNNGESGLFIVGTLAATESTIDDNSNSTIPFGGTFVGGGVFLNGSGTLVDCTISGNEAYYGGGGVMSVRASSMTIEGCTISDNSAEYGGGVFADGDTLLTMSGCAITGNTSVYQSIYGQAGGFENFYSTSKLTDCTIAGNSAGEFGGGLADQGANLSLVACTVSGNSGGTDGGAGLYIYGFQTHPSATLIDTILAGNTTGGQPDEIDGPFADVVSGSNNLIGPGGSGGLIASNANQLDVANPGLTALGDYGGPTETFALQPTSPAIAAGIAVSGVVADQRGFPISGPADIGAFQAESGPLVVNTPIDGVGSPSGDLSLRQAVNLADVQTGGATITFDRSVFARPKTISLTAGPLELSNTTGPIVVRGPGSGKLSVSGGGLSRVFQVDSGVTASLSGLTITDGVTTGNGGGVLNQGTLALIDDAIEGNSAVDGGGIANSGTVTILGTLIADNNASADGGGLYNTGTATLISCTIDQNTASTGGGIDAESSGSPVILLGSSISRNKGGNTAGRVIQL